MLTLSEAATLLRVDPPELERLAEEGDVPGRRIAGSWRFSCPALMAWLDGAPTPLPFGELAATSAAGTTNRQGPGAQTDTPTTTPDPDEPIGDAPGERTAGDVFLRGQRVLLGRAEVVIDLGQFYARRDRQELMTVDGNPALATLEQETLATLIVGRVGIFSETEVFASTTFQSQSDAAILGSTRIGHSRQTGLGSLGLGVRRTLLREGAGRPDVIATLSTQIPRGNDTYAIGAGLVLVKSVDPVVLFASADYGFGFGRTLADTTRLDPGNQLNLTMGYGLALNDTLAISTAVAGVFAEPTLINAEPTRQPDRFSARLALTSWIAEGLYVEPSVSFGLGGPDDSVAFGVTIPYAF